MGRCGVERGTRWVRVIGAVLVLLALAGPIGNPGRVGAQGEEDGLTSETSYESPQFGYSLEWDEAWTVESVLSVEAATLDTLLLASEDASLAVVGSGDRASPADALEMFVTGREETAADLEVIDQDPEADIPSATLAYTASGATGGGDGPVREYVEVRALDQPDSALTIAFQAPEEGFDTALADAQAAVTFDGEPVFVNVAQDQSEETPEADTDPETPEADADPEPTAEPDPTETADDRTGAGNDGSEEPLDVAAMTLLPSDLDQRGFVADSGSRLSLEEVAQAAAEYRGGDDRDVQDFADALEEAGFRTYYIARLALPDEEDPTLYARVINSYVIEYATVEGAADGFTLLEDEEGVASAEDLPGAEEFGDESEITRDRGRTNGDDPVRYESLDLTFRVDNLVAGVTVTDYAGENPAEEEVETLAAVALDRIEAVRADGSAELGLRVLRLAADEDAPFSYQDEKYDRRDGETVPLAGETEEDFELREAELPSATDIYDLEQIVDLDDGEPLDNPYYIARIVHFEDEGDAETFFDEVVDGFLDNPGGYQDPERLEDLPAVGDRVDGFTYEFEVSDDVTVQGTRIYALVGPDVVFVQVDAAEPVPDAVTELIEAQAACLEAGEVCEPVAIPRDVLATRSPGSSEEDPPATEEDGTPAAGRDDADAKDTPEPRPTRTAAAGVEGDTYTSPSFGYTISWDPDIWEVENEASEEGFDQLRLGDPPNTVYLNGIEAFDGDPATCLQETADALAGGEGVSKFGPAEDRNGDPIAGERADRAFAQYELTLTRDGERVSITNYVECRVLVPDEAVLAIVYIVATDEFEDQFPLVEDLLDAIEIPEDR